MTAYNATTNKVATESDLDSRALAPVSAVIAVTTGTGAASESVDLTGRTVGDYIVITGADATEFTLTALTNVNGTLTSGTDAILAIVIDITGGSETVLRIK